MSLRRISRERGGIRKSCRGRKSRKTQICLHITLDVDIDTAIIGIMGGEGIMAC